MMPLVNITLQPSQSTTEMSTTAADSILNSTVDITTEYSSTTDSTLVTTQVVSTEPEFVTTVEMSTLASTISADQHNGTVY